MAIDCGGGTGRYAFVADNAAHDVTGNYLTLSIWLSLDSTGLDAGLIGKWDGPDNVGSAYLLWLNGSNQIQFMIANGASAESTGSSSVIPVGVWTHIAGVKTPTGRAIYLNGKLNVVAASTISIWNSAKTFFVGVYGNAAQSLDGKLADAAVWDAALTPDEVYMLSRGLRAKHIRPNNLRGYWPLQKGGADTELLRDESRYNVSLATASGTLLTAPDPPQLDDLTNQLQRIPLSKIPGAISRGNLIRRYAAPLNHQGSRLMPGGTGNPLLYYPGASASPILNFASDHMTAMIWFAPGATANGSQIMCREDGTASAWDCYYQSSRVEARIINGGSDTVLSTTNIASAANQDKWWHICVRKDGQGANTLHMLINGILEGSVTCNRTVPSANADTCVGNRGQVDSEALGYFADFAMWNAALTNEEIWRVMKGESPLRVRPGNLRGYWPLNDYETTLANAGNARDHAWNNNLLMWSGGANIALSSKNPHRHNQRLDGMLVDTPTYGGEVILAAVPYTTEVLSV